MFQCLYDRTGNGARGWRVGPDVAAALGRVGRVQLLAAAQLSLVPSSYVRDSNLVSGATSDVARPWFGVGVVYDR